MVWEWAFRDEREGGGVRDEKNSEKRSYLFFYIRLFLSIQTIFCNNSQAIP
jgi:hypothetical protein